MNNKTAIMCPAHRCKPGSKLLGIRQNDGTIAILPQPLPIDEDFIENTKEHPISPERRFRFTNKCIEGGCKQWNGTSCSVAENVMYYLTDLPISETLPTCSIRGNCRWFVQEGNYACKICSFIPTEIVQKD